MSVVNLTGQTFEGYTLVEVTASIADESVFLAERVRDGEKVWVRTPRSTGEADDTERFAARYEAESVASRRLSSVGAVLAVRELIRIGDAPGLVSDVPLGRSLNDVFAARRGTPRISEVLPWFRKLVQAIEAAHDEDGAHGSLRGRDVFLRDDGRITICGLAIGGEEDPADARRRDVRALAELMYTATSGRAPRRGFPDTGMPVSPEKFVEDYPSSLARFLCRRMADDEDDPVEDAGVFRRSIDALAVDPDFRKAAGISDDVVTAASDAIVERTTPRRWRKLAYVLGMSAAAVVFSVVATIAIMEVRVEQARREGAASTAAELPERVLEKPDHPRLAIWACLHHRFIASEAGPIAPNSINDCLRNGPDIPIEDIRDEAALLVKQLREPLTADDSASSIGVGYARIFDQGADAVAQHVSYRLQRDLSIDPLEAWIVANSKPEITAVMRTLAGRKDDVAQWSRQTLKRAGLSWRGEL